MQEILGSSLPVFFGLTVGLMGFCGYMAGQALAATWRPLWLVVPYAILLGLADRFLNFALFKNELLTLSGFLIDTSVILVICLFAFRVTQVAKMVEQYPWLYRRTSPWSYSQEPAEGGAVGE